MRAKMKLQNLQLNTHTNEILSMKTDKRCDDEQFKRQVALGNLLNSIKIQQKKLFGTTAKLFEKSVNSRG